METNISKNAHWLLRIALASSFIYHGATKFPDLSGTAEMMGLPVFVLFLVALAETIGGTLVLLGGFLKEWMTRIGALMVVPVMLGAIVMVHIGRWSFTPSESHPIGGVEFPVILLLLSLYLAIRGNEKSL
jgi:putative oxidoreductase